MLPLRLNVSQPQSLIQNFWQRYASHAIAVPGACVANERDIDGSVAKLCFLIGRIILPVTLAVANSFSCNGDLDRVRCPRKHELARSDKWKHEMARSADPRTQRKTLIVA